MNKIDRVKEVSGELCEYLNGDLLQRFGDVHNIKPKYNKFYLKQEVVADKALFMEVKKKYVLHIVDNEGKSVDEYDYKGMVMRRSEYPQHTKKCVSELIGMIFENDSIDFGKLYKYIEEKNKEFMDLVLANDKDIAKHVTYSKKKEDYKNGRIPYQIMAMELWNTLEYECFLKGTKGYLYNIIGVDRSLAPPHVLDSINKITSKNTAIVLPFEEDVLPDYYIVNHEKMFSYCWGDRVNECLAPLISDDITTF